MNVSRFLRSSIVASGLVLGTALTGHVAHAAVITLSAANRGSVSSTGGGIGNGATNNYLAGLSDSTEYRNFFGFNLSSLAGQNITSAQLSVSKGGYISSDASETLGLFDVNSTTALSNQSMAQNQSVFADLGSGTSYGSFTIASGAPATLIIDLNSSAITALNARNGGYFNIGGAVTSLSATDTQLIFGSTTGASSVTQLIVNTAPVPEPSTWAMMALGVGALCLVGRKRAGDLA